MQYDYRVPLDAYFENGTEGYYEFQASNDQEAMVKIGTVGTPFLEILVCGVWKPLTAN